jgi:hypothetical protein
MGKREGVRACLPLPGATAHAPAFAVHALIAGLALSSESQQAVRDWQYVWSLELLGLTIGVVGFTLTYLRDDESPPSRSITA